MSSILEILLPELLRKAGILTDEQVNSIVGIKSLSQLLEDIKVIPPLSKRDKAVIKEWDQLISGRWFVYEKLDRVRVYRLDDVEDDSLRRILESLREKILTLVEK